MVIVQKSLAGEAANAVVVKTVSELRRVIEAWRQQGLTIGFVPTMGALHDAHMSLVEEAKRQCDRVVVSVFVNPTQFNRPEDLERYPRPFEKDVALCRQHGVHLVFNPEVAEVYPNGFSTNIHIGDVTARWEGSFRPGHFDGVATIVSKLLLMVLPTKAFFGEKDLQQLLMIKVMVRDLNIPVEIVPVKNMREKDGLAYSSRNLLLTPEQRAIAPALFRCLCDAARRVAGGENPAATTADVIFNLRQAGFDKVDYIGICDAETLQPLTEPAKSGRIVAAAWLGGVRLIDNIAIEEALS